MYDKGVHVEKILALGRWASASTFEKYYKRAKRLGTFSVAQTLVGETTPAPQARKDSGVAQPGPSQGPSQGPKFVSPSPSIKEGDRVKLLKDSRGVNTSRPIPEAQAGHNKLNCHCWACNSKDARMIHCKSCNIHLHRHHFGESPADHHLAETEFLNEGWQCERCQSISSWSTYNLKTRQKSTEKKLRENKLWHVGSLDKHQMKMVETIMQDD